jgi:hypothetical protein
MRQVATGATFDQALSSMAYSVGLLRAATDSGDPLRTFDLDFLPHNELRSLTLVP